MGLLSPPVILPYRGYGTQRQVHLKGHVLDDRVLYDSSHQDRKRKNFRAMLSRYVSSPIPDVRVEVCFMNKESVVTTDEAGYFEVVFTYDEELAIHGWHTAQYKVLDKIVDDQEELEVHGEVYIHGQKSSYGIISDVDDTILISHSTKAVRKLRLILTKNSKTRLPFTGVAAFYNALHKGDDQMVKNPVFYVSSSEWNLYDFLEDFCDVRNLPKGPFLLQDLKTSLRKLVTTGGGTHEHKLEKIRHLLKTFEDLSFILIGDSGQRDSTLYAQVTREFPGRVKAIYIRDVTRKAKDVRVNEIARELKAQEVEMLLVSDTAEAAQHAYVRGLITKEELENVITETRKEKQKPETLVGQIVEHESIKD